MTHSPAPWSIDRTCWIVDRDGLDVAAVLGDDDDCPARTLSADANGRLICAAPDMLRLLERVRDVFSGDVRPNHRAIVDDIDEFITGMQQDSMGAAK
jgi:hypothetical protein